MKSYTLLFRPGALKIHNLLFEGIELISERSQQRIVNSSTLHAFLRMNEPKIVSLLSFGRNFFLV